MFGKVLQCSAGPGLLVTFEVNVFLLQEDFCLCTYLKRFLWLTFCGQLQERELSG
jgi:hypothetical protein